MKELWRYGINMGSMKVKLLESTKDAVNLIYSACRQCYSARFAAEIFRDKKISKKEKALFIRKIVSSGHESPLEHAKFTFAVEGVSRALTHQLVRHRIASYSQQSQRYVKDESFSYVTPPVFKSDTLLMKEYESCMKMISGCYGRLISILERKGIKGESANQDARFILPQGAETKIVITMNCRELIHFFKQRCCARAQWEIRQLAWNMLKICAKKMPEIFSGIGPKCETLKYCPEGRDFSCGRYPVKQNFDR
ncbi:FAD-dependent thymidylate synthase [bacterium]|jgi:thymidylate synthase (FAD)|nr:FAD-dependent thymidylate synthase [bacterium]